MHELAHTKKVRYTVKIKDFVKDLRKKGYSLGQIYEKTHVPKTTIRLWIKDIVLTQEQQQILKERTNKALQEGRIRIQKANKDMRQRNEREISLSSEDQTKELTLKEFLVAGIALYWGEGFKNKHEHRLGFCNSDPEMILFYVKWLQEVLKVDKEDLVLRLTLNASYKSKTKEIEKYWSSVTNIPVTQFRKPFYQYSDWKKQYKTENYHGVLRIHVNNSLNYLWQMKGWIQGLKHAKIQSLAG